MNKIMEEISKIKSNDEVSEEKIFETMKEIIEKEKTEYPNSSLFSMVIDSVDGKRSIFKIKTHIEAGRFQENFKILE